MKQTTDIICIVLALVVGTIASSPCPDGFVLVGEKCYYFGMSLSDWSSSERECRIIGGHLASPQTSQENEQLATYLYNNYRSYNQSWWLDGSDAAQEGRWVWSATNTSINYGYWYPGQPDNDTGENCLHFENLYNYKWDDYYCNYKEFYICEHSIVTPAPCPYGWVSLGEHCYYFHTAPNSWIGAESKCQEAGAHLAYPVTSEENQLIFDYILANFSTSGQDWWIGGSDAAEEGSWAWVETNTAIDYSFWADNEPNNSYNEDCISYCNKYGYKWNDNNCDYALSFICQL